MIDLDKVQVGDPIWLYRPRRGDYHKAKVTKVFYQRGSITSDQPFAILVKYHKRECKFTTQRINRSNSADALINDTISKIKKGRGYEKLRNFKFGIQSYSFSTSFDMMKFVDTYVGVRSINKSLKEEILACKNYQSSWWI